MVFGPLLTGVSLALSLASAPVEGQGSPRFEGLDFRQQDNASEIRLRFDRAATTEHEVIGNALFIYAQARGERQDYNPTGGLIRLVEIFASGTQRLEIRLHAEPGTHFELIPRGAYLIVRATVASVLAPPSVPPAVIEVPEGLSTLELRQLPADLAELHIDHITLDPGHGGQDSGAYAPQFGLLEKEVVLDIALKLEALLLRYTHARVALTRRGDYFVDLSERTLIANQHRSDLFISLHLNASQAHDHHGTEIYYFSEKPSNRAAELVSLRENGPAPSRFRPQAGLIDLDTFLLRAERQIFWRDGEKIARRMQRRLVRDLGTADRKVKSANFMVLREARMPAVLVEMAFIDHPRDARRLQEEDFRWDIAGSLLNELRELVAR